MSKNQLIFFANAKVNKEIQRRQPWPET